MVDRIGSGDAYVSGALYGYLKHKDCRKALEYGNAMAAIKHSVIGDMITTDLEEIDSIIAEHKNTGVSFGDEPIECTLYEHSIVVN